jgi:hypothetical protein
MSDDFEEHVQSIEAMAARLSAAAQVFREAGLILRGGVGPTAGPMATARVTSGPNLAPMSPFPCPSCGRNGPEALGESVQARSCAQCGNRLPGGNLVVRPPGPPTRTLNGDFDGFSPHEQAERARLLKQNLPEELPAGIAQMEAEP